MANQRNDIETKGVTGRFHGDLPERTFHFASLIINLFDQIPSCPKGWVLSRQLLRSGTSIGANVREADQALTDAEFVQRCSIARKEASETDYWLGLCVVAELLSEVEAAPVREEALELLRILSTIIRKCQTRPTTGRQSQSRSKNSDANASDTATLERSS